MYAIWMFDDKILIDKEFATKLGKQGYEFVCKNFGWERITSQLIKIYSQLRLARE